MSGKKLKDLWPADHCVRSVRPTSAVDGTRLTIEFVSGFEKFNTRAYHNYETWGDGWRVTDPETGIILEREDLDDALLAWKHAVEHKEE